MDKNYVIVYSDAYNVVKIHIGSITRIPSIVLIFFFSLCGRRLKGNGRGNSGVRDHGGRKGTPAFFRVPAFPLPFPLHDKRFKGEGKGKF